MLVHPTIGIAAVLLALATCGCGTSGAPEGNAAAANAAGATPDRVVAQFLEAVRTGDDASAARLLTPQARQKTEEMEMVVAPPGSETAKYEVLDVQYVGGVAHVASHWSDLDTDGLTHVDRIVWVLRSGADGWRISGMTTRVFADAEPIVLNFEDPADMVQKQQQAEEEIARRHRQTAPAPQSSSNSPLPAIR